MAHLKSNLKWNINKPKNTNIQASIIQIRNEINNDLKKPPN